MKFHWDFIAVLLNPEADDCQAGGKEMYLPVFCNVWQFCCQTDEISVTESGKWRAVLHRLNSWVLMIPLKSKQVFLLVLLRNQDKQNNNGRTFSNHIFLNVHCVKICALWGIQYSAFAPDFSSNHSLFLISCKVSFHLLWPVLQLMIYCLLLECLPGLYLCPQDAQRGFWTCIGWPFDQSETWSKFLPIICCLVPSCPPGSDLKTTFLWDSHQK